MPEADKVTDRSESQDSGRSSAPKEEQAPKKTALQEPVEQPPIRNQKKLQG